MAIGSLKLNLEALKKDAPLGFHDEFMSKLDECSESWREAAQREKRHS
jgi:lysylphosphatidylglycerol synthetase-like protein (DUF2156 family)